MDNNIYTITLDDGTKLSNLRLNGNNFISDEVITADIFKGKFFSATISNGESEEVHKNMTLIHVTKMNDEYWFALRDISDSELAKEQLRADIDFIAAMMGVEL